MWDLGLYIAGTEAIVQRSCSKAAMECEDGWLDVPDVLAFYDYVGHNPAKGGLFRVGAMNSGLCRVQGSVHLPVLPSAAS